MVSKAFSTAAIGNDAYRPRLVADMETGKLDVRAAANLPAEMEIPDEKVAPDESAEEIGTEKTKA